MSVRNVRMPDVCSLLCVCVCMCDGVALRSLWTDSGVCCRLLVGAPKAKALSGHTAKVTGGLYSCDMSLPDCRRVNFDNNGEIPAKSSTHNFTSPVCVRIFLFLCLLSILTLVSVQRIQPERAKRTSGWECQSAVRAPEERLW